MYEPIPVQESLSDNLHLQCTFMYTLKLHVHAKLSSPKLARYYMHMVNSDIP